MSGKREEGACIVREPLPDTQEGRLARLMRRCGHHLYHNGPERAGQLRILVILSVVGPMSQRVLQEALEVKPGSLSEILGKMESAGLVERTQNPQDRRAMDLAATEQGLREMHELRALHDRELAVLFSPLNREEQAELETLLDRLLTAWRGPEDGAER